MHNELHINPMCMCVATPSVCFLSYEYRVTYARHPHSRTIHHVGVGTTQSMALRDAFGYRFVPLFHIGLLSYHIFLDLCKANIGYLLSVRTENNISYDKPR